MQQSHGVSKNKIKLSYSHSLQIDLLIDQSTYDALVEFSDSVEGVSEKISGVLGLIGSTKEFQMA